MKKQVKQRRHKLREDFGVMLALRDGMVCAILTNGADDLSKQKELKVIKVGPVQEVITYWFLSMGVTKATLEDYKLKFEYKEQKKSSVLAFFSRGARR